MLMIVEPSFEIESNRKGLIKEYTTNEFYHLNKEYLIKIIKNNKIIKRYEIKPGF